MSPERSNLIYLDNAATSWPKPPCVAVAMHEYMTQVGIGFGRSNSRHAESIRSTIEGLRRDLAEMLNARSDEIILTNSATDGLNLVIHGLLLHRFGAKCQATNSKSGATTPALVITTQTEHNSVLRPLRSWVRRGWIRLATLRCDHLGNVDWETLDELLAERPIMLCVSHASNVTGAIQSLAGIGDRCRASGTLFLIDAAQTLGWLPIDVGTLACDFLIAAGHKGLCGPLGTGVAFIRRDRQGEVDSLRLGGTGASVFNDDEEPAGPTKWEGGNLNVPGLIGLAAAIRGRHQSFAAHAIDAADAADAIDATLSWSDASSKNQMLKLASHLWESLDSLNGVTRIADPGYDPFADGTLRLPIISLTFADWDPTSLALALESAADLVTRSGYHCAPTIHSALGTTKDGTLRISLGPYNTMQHVVTLRETLEMVCRF